jgi:transcriptional regulator with XRE-family HTH domain
MSERNGRESVEAVLDAFMASEPDPSGAVLREWIRRYPYYERELTDFAVGWILMDTLPPDPDTEEPDEEALMRRGTTIIEDLLPGEEDEQLSREEHRSFVGLLGEAKDLGLTMYELANVTGLSAALVAKLDQRLIRAATVPTEVLGDLARAIQRTTEEVLDHLRREPVLPTALEHKAEVAPAVPDQQDFFDAVRGDRGLDDERRRRLLSLARPNAG